MMPYGEWTEVNSLKEGHFLERFAPGALAGNAIPAMAKRIRVLFEHGLDTVLGRQAIAAIEEMRDEPDGAYYRARLLDGLPELLVAGLRRGPYGSSVRFEPLKQDRVRYPKRSEYNPEGLPEHTVREARIREFSVVTFPQYAGATA
jgi:HK97 family phage prohead protease